MKTGNKYRAKFAGAFLFTCIATRITFAQTALQPGLAITSLGTNQLSINITNSIGTNEYDLLWTPVLDNPEFPWVWAAIGTPGQTNFIINMESYPSGFFVTFFDTNSIPLWEAANPTNQALGILTVIIDSPTNGAVLQ